MKHCSKIGYLAIVLTALSFRLSAQDGVEIRGLQSNPALIHAASQPSLRKSAKASKSLNVLKLPFFEDFSVFNTPYPNPDLWQDKSTYVNIGFPYLPPTIGVVTFDALDENGRMYAQASTFSFYADTLTSHPFQMDSAFGQNPRPLNSSDSLYFSFYYQPGGGFGKEGEATVRGRAPARGDLLILEFLNDTVWEKIWDVEFLKDSKDFSKDSTLERNWSKGNVFTEKFSPFGHDSTAPKNYFKHVIIPVMNPAYRINGFQFRFRNMSSLDESWRTSGGQWHVDYIRLDADSAVNVRFSEGDIAFVEKSPRILKDFQAMPFRQFRPETDLVDNLNLVFRNLSRNAIAVEHAQHIFDRSNTLVWNTPPNDFNPDVAPFHLSGFNSSPDISKQPLSYLFPVVNQSNTFQIRHVITNKSSSRRDIHTQNDTMVQTVAFDNYYAYDDGSAEAVFGLNNADGQFAYRFPLVEQDTLVAIQIQFNHSNEDMNRAFFKLKIWNAAGDTLPDNDSIVRKDDCKPEYDDPIGYTTYYLDQPVILPKGSFFIGFQQKTDAFLNIGFDQNNNAPNRMFYYNQSSGQWESIFYYGSVMMRPVFGSSVEAGFRNRPVVADRIQIYPNPSDGLISVESSEALVTSYEVYDLSGRRWMQQSCNHSQLSIRLPEQTGVYILLLNTEKGIISKKVVRR
ncbi:MAG: T9SS type A sorting domain-containing protein [Bacteroidales bacterium]|jgi:hypothetical protein|nr:T9SS type A sorting domain-containing protein [Bacteroidales bacterium]